MADNTANRKLFKENRVNKAEPEVISITAAEILRWTSTFVSIGVKFVLAVYFLIIYRREKMIVPLVWGVGFLFFGLSQIPILALRYFKDPATNIAFALLAALLAALSLALLYYGASLIYFRKDSFMREKLSIMFFVAMLAAILVVLFVVAPGDILTSIFFVVATGFILPMLLIVSLIFFVIWRKLDRANPRRPNVFLVSAAWAVYSVVNGVGSFSVGTPFEWAFYTLATIAFFVLLYGMTLGRATGH